MPFFPSDFFRLRITQNGKKNNVKCRHLTTIVVLSRAPKGLGECLCSNINTVISRNNKDIRNGNHEIEYVVFYQNRSAMFWAEYLSQNVFNNLNGTTIVFIVKMNKLETKSYKSCHIFPCSN